MYQHLSILITIMLSHPSLYPLVLIFSLRYPSLLLFRVLSTPAFPQPLLVREVSHQTFSSRLCLNLHCCPDVFPAETLSCHPAFLMLPHVRSFYSQKLTREHIYTRSFTLTRSCRKRSYSAEYYVLKLYETLLITVPKERKKKCC